MNFIDLYAGIGGFHQALSSLGHKCVWACEINEKLRSLYQQNFNLYPDKDITKVDINSIPAHDILCAGFPCQPFSFASMKREGLKDVKKGCFFDYILQILRIKQPSYFILENVPGLKTQNKGAAYTYIINSLNQLNYNVQDYILSPIQYNIPHRRDRIFFIGSKKKFTNIYSIKKTEKTIVDTILEKNPICIEKIKSPYIEIIKLWQAFLNILADNNLLNDLPRLIFSSDFYEEINLNNLSFQLQKEIKTSRDFYNNFANPYLVKWVKDLKKLNLSFTNHRLEITNRKMLLENHNLQNYILYPYRGLRVLPRTYIPSLLANSSRNFAIINNNRKLTIKEGLRLQSMNENLILHDSYLQAFKALGNSVNVKVVKEISSFLLNNA